jgi:hypothetical protein
MSCNGKASLCDHTYIQLSLELDQQFKSCSSIGLSASMGKKLKGIKLTSTPKEDDVKCMEWVVKKQCRGAYGKMVKGSWPLRKTQSVQSSPTKSQSDRRSERMLYQGGQAQEGNMDFDQHDLPFPSYPVPKSLVRGGSCCQH